MPRGHWSSNTRSRPNNNSTVKKLDPYMIRLVQQGEVETALDIVFAASHNKLGNRHWTAFDWLRVMNNHYDFTMWRLLIG